MGHVNPGAIDPVPLHLAQPGLTDRPPWWQMPSDILACFEGVSPSGCKWYRIADASLGIESDDFALRTRFQRVYGECVSSYNATVEPRLHCRVQIVNEVPARSVTFSGPGETELVDFMLDLFRDRGYVELNPETSGWRAIGLTGRSHPILISKGNHCLVDAAEPWQPLIANCAVNWAMSMQPDVLFFHAGAVGVGDAGVLIIGGKGSGKTTLSMALAARGQDFLGDEVAAVRTHTTELLPMRRAVSIRHGPRSSSVDRTLRDRRYPTEQFPDGSTRVRVDPGEFFPSAHERSPLLRSIFFLRAFEDRARVESFQPRVPDLRLLAPLPCTFWGTSPAKPLMQAARLLSSANCYNLYPGMPDETASLVERIVRN